MGLVAGRVGPALAQNLFGLRPESPEVPPLPVPLSGEPRIERRHSYGGHARQRFDWIRPPAEAPGPYPGVVLFHGGGFARGTTKDVESIARALALRGFAVVNAEYRLLPEADLNEIVADAVSVTRYAHAHADELDIAAERLALMGRSAGGHLALMAAYTGGVPVRAVVSEAGPTDLDPVMWDGSVRGAVMRRYSKSADTRALSPVHVASAEAPPTLLIHGCRDHNVPFAHARILQVRLEGLGVPVRLVAVPRTGHNPLRWRWRVGLAVVYQWLMSEAQLVAREGLARNAHPGLRLSSDHGPCDDRAHDHRADGDPEPGRLPH